MHAWAPASVLPLLQQITGHWMNPLGTEGRRACVCTRCSLQAAAHRKGAKHAPRVLPPALQRAPARAPGHIPAACAAQHGRLPA